MQLGGAPMRKMPELYACLYAKEFPAQALLRLRPDIGTQACVVLEGDPPQQTVCAMNPRARALGAERGMTRVEVDTLPPLHILARSPMQAAAAKTALLECAGGFSPRVEDRSTDNAFIAVIDCRRSLEMSCPCPLEMSGSKDGLDFYERTRSEADRSVE